MFHPINIASEGRNRDGIPWEITSFCYDAADSQPGPGVTMKYPSAWLACLFSLGFSSTANAAGGVPGTDLAVFGLEVGGGYFLAEVDGDVVAGVDVKNDLDIEDIGSPYFYFNFEHALPLVPNLRVARTHIDEESQGRLDQTFTYKGRSFTTGQVVLNKVDFSHTDITLYHDFWDMGGDFDLGLTARWFDGEVDLAGTIESADVLIPMVYANARIDLPFSGLYLGAQANVGSMSGDSISDAEVKVGWRREDFILPDFSVEVGYRNYTIDVEESVNIDLDLTGAFINFKGNL
jgi:outer membrane protein